MMVMGVKREKRRSHDVGPFLYAHISPQTPPLPPLLAVPAPPGAHRENQALEQDPGFVAGLPGPMREKECCAKLRPFMMLSGVLKKD